MPLRRGQRASYLLGGEMRTLKDGWPIYKEWIEIKDGGKREHWVLTDCYHCSVNYVTMPLSKLVAQGPELCEGCGAYQAHERG